MSFKMNAEMLASVANVGFKERLDQLIEEGFIDLKLFQSDEGQEELSKKLLSKMADTLADNLEGESAYIDMAVCSMLLQIMEAKSPAFIMSGEEDPEPQTVQSAPGTTAKSVDVKNADAALGDGQHPTRTSRAPQVEFGGVKD